MAKAPAKKVVKKSATGSAKRSRAATPRRAPRKKQEEQRQEYTILFRLSAASVVVDPSIVVVCANDTVLFQDETGGEVKLYMATGGVLKGIREMAAVRVPRKATGKGYEVIGKPDVYECMAHYKFKDKKGKVHTGFAIGASSPKIIIRPT